MRCRHSLSATAAIGGLVTLSLGGCMQMTRHSNTLVFGTNTSLGIVVGADATSTPSISVGFKRQEAVVMPLVANVSADGELLSPCLIGPAAGSQLGTRSIETIDTHPCLLVGHDGVGKTDAYSVLASFGSKYDAKSSGVGGSIAQYFATGLAAQHLALSGGAAVATGQAAAVSANPANVLLREAIATADTNDPGNTPKASHQQSLDVLANAIARQAPDALDRALTDIDGRLKTTIRKTCAGATPTDCAEKIRKAEGGLLSVGADAIKREADGLGGQ